MLQETAQALASLKVITDLALLVIKTSKDAAVTEKAIELNTAIISLQQAMLATQAQNQELLTENDQLKKELIAVKDWKTEAANYTLKEIIPGSFVYAINEDQLSAQPYHWLCVNCYQGSQKSVLQRGKRDGSFWLYSCPKCEKSIYGNDDPKRLLITAE